MIAVKQRFRHRPEKGIQGDCHRAALASLLELDVDSVPHFTQDNPGVPEFSRRVEEWLGARNLASANIPLVGSMSDILATLANCSPGVFWILAGRTRLGNHHTVVGRDGAIVHDPSPHRAEGIIGPCRDGVYWVTFLVVKDPAQYVSLVPVVKRNRFREAWEFFRAIWW